MKAVDDLNVRLRILKWDWGEAGRAYGKASVWSGIAPTGGELVGALNLYAKLHRQAKIPCDWDYEQIVAVTPFYIEAMDKFNRGWFVGREEAATIRMDVSNPRYAKFHAVKFKQHGYWQRYGEYAWLGEYGEELRFQVYSYEMIEPVLEQIAINWSDAPITAHPTAMKTRRVTNYAFRFGDHSYCFGPYTSESGACPTDLIMTEAHIYVLDVLKFKPLQRAEGEVITVKAL